MVNRYTAGRRIRSDNAYTPHGVAGARPDRCLLVYAQRVREAFTDVPLVVGGIEASLRRIAHFDYWSGLPDAPRPGQRRGSVPPRRGRR